VHVDAAAVQNKRQKKRLVCHRSKDDGSVVAYCKRLK